MEVCEIYPRKNSNDEPDEVKDDELSENEDDDRRLDYNQQLRDRIITLRTTVYDLKKQLKEEREGWQKEIQNANAAPPDHFAENLKYSQNMTYEEISQLHQETKAQLQRQLAITNYKRRLLEVESMCNMELMRVKQNVMFLQPLQMMMSEWNLDGNTNVPIDQSGDHLSVHSDKNESSSDSDLKSKDSSNPLEMISTKLYNDMNDMFNILTAHCQETIPNWNQENALNSQSSTVFSDCDQSEMS